MFAESSELESHTCEGALCLANRYEALLVLLSEMVGPDGIEPSPTG